MAQNGVHFLSDGEREALRRIVEEHGLAGAAKLLDISRGTVSAAAAGAGVRRGSITLLREALTKRVQAVESVLARKKKA